MKEEMGFLVDLHLFLGRSLVAAPVKPPESRDEARRIADEADEAQRSVVGIIPPTSLDLVQDRVRELFDARTELDGLRRACDNAYKLYQRTRGSAANESVARGAELIESIGPSPTMCAALRDEAQLDAAGLAEIAQQIRAYRPVATVFEADIANAAKGQSLLATAARLNPTMAAKRKQHDTFIQKAKEDGHGIVARRRRRPEQQDDEDDSDEGDSDDEFGDDDGEGEEEAEKNPKGKGKKKKKAVNVADAFDTGKFRDNEFFLDVTPRGVNHTELGLSTM